MGYDRKYGKVTTEFGDIEENVKMWQHNNSEKLKVPDSETSKSWMKGE